MLSQKQNKKLSFTQLLSLKLWTIFRLIIDFIAVIIGLRFPTEQNYLPPITNSLLLEPAVELCKKIKSGQIFSEDVVKAYIERCISVQPHINAIIQNNFESAIAEAKHVDRRVRHELEGNQPLDGRSIHTQPFLGIPFTAKDSFAVKDMNWTSGLYSRKGITGSVDSDVIALMRKSGAIFIAMTNVPELIMWWHSTNILYGRTCNPYDKSRIPGGSSGGECALVSAAGSLIGIGSDIGGSIREPSFFCGVFGHKTTSGVISINGIYPHFSEAKQKLLAVGPFCRYATDLRPMLRVMAGNNAAKLKLDESIDFGKIKVYYMEGHNNPAISPLEPEIKDALNRVIDYLRNKCSKCQRIYLNELEVGFDIWMCAMTDKTEPSLEEQLANLNGKIDPYIEFVKSVFGLSNYTFTSIVSCFDDCITGLSNEQYFNQLTQMRDKLTQELHKRLSNDGVFIYPGHPEIAPKHNGTLLKVKNISYTCVFNTLDVAITSVPLGLTKSGLPIGVQVISAPYNDRLSIAVAEELEKRFGGWDSPSLIEC